MTPRLRRLTLLTAALTLACRTTPGPAPVARPAASDVPSASSVGARESERSVPTGSSGATAASSDPGIPFVRAWDANRSGEPDRAMELLRDADRLGFDIPLDPNDFPGLSERPEWKEIAARTAAREPRTPAARVAFALAERGLVAEGIAADPETGDLFVSSIRQRKILRVRPDGEVSDFVATAEGGLLAPLGMKIDAGRNLLWVAANASPAMVGWEPSLRGRSGLFAFDRTTGELRRSAFITGEKHLLNDVAIPPDGTVYVTDSEAGAVRRLDPGATELRSVVEGGFFYPNGIAIVGDHVVFAHAMGMHAVPLAGGAPVPISGPAGFALGGIDGLATDGRTLFAIQNGLGKPRVVRLELDGSPPRVAAARVIETANPLWRVPTTGALARGSLVYVANSHVDALSDAGVGPAAMVETILLALPAQ